jgi:hypothetical protein
MNRYKLLLSIPVIIGVLIAGCASNSQKVLSTEPAKNNAKVIAVLPVDNKTADVKAPVLLRLKVLDELYFKGYNKLSLEEIDKKLEPIYKSETKGTKGIIAPQVLKELVGADAVMYCTLTEGKRSISMFYAPVTVAARCELRSTQTGEVLWNSQYKSTSRNFDFTNKRLEMKSNEAFETVIEEVVNKVMETLPDGPNLRG